MAKPPEEGPTPINPFTHLFFWAIGLSVAWYALNNVINFFGSIGDFNTYMVNNNGGPDGWYANLLVFWDGFVVLYSQLATIVSAILVLGILYALMRLRHIRREQNKKDSQSVRQTQTKTQGGSRGNDKWQKIIGHVNSDNPAQWRLAILEADVLLDELLNIKNYRGETLGEKLKNADPGSFKTIQAAWEAHKVRNAIAHEGSDFLVNQREAKRVVDLYERVFREFSFI